jgi:hypothetical protein
VIVNREFAAIARSLRGSLRGIGEEGYGEFTKKFVGNWQEFTIGSFLKNFLKKGLIPNSIYVTLASVTLCVMAVVRALCGDTWRCQRSVALSK